MTIPSTSPLNWHAKPPTAGSISRSISTQILPAAAKPVLPRSPRLTQAEIDAVLDGLAEFSDKIPILPDSAFTREAIYSDHD